MGGLVGSWRLVSWTSRDDDGAVSLPMGEGPTGAVLYSGPYAVQGDTVVHTPVAGLVPDWIGVEQVRHWAIDGDTLVLRTPPFEMGGKRQVSEVLWERVGGDG